MNATCLPGQMAEEAGLHGCSLVDRRIPGLEADRMDVAREEWERRGCEELRRAIVQEGRHMETVVQEERHTETAGREVHRTVTAGREAHHEARELEEDHRKAIVQEGRRMAIEQGAVHHRVTGLVAEDLGQEEVAVELALRLRSMSRIRLWYQSGHPAGHPSACRRRP